MLAFALMFVMEGVLPFVLPGLWRESFMKLSQLSDGQVRFIGLTAMASGLILLFLFNQASE
ncbi:MAG: DUF2065 domain-containing protein [Burkholderiales bacterium]|nr:DUF2065 domain-containing protein [Burkholderiales bacterium]